MNKLDFEALYMTLAETAGYLNVSHQRVWALVKAGQLESMKGGVYLRSDVEAYKAKRGDRKGGRYPKAKEPSADG